MTDSVQSPEVLYAVYVCLWEDNVGGGRSNKNQAWDGIKSREIGLFISEKVLDGLVPRAGLGKIYTLLQELCSYQQWRRKAEP